MHEDNNNNLSFLVFQYFRLCYSVIFIRLSCNESHFFPQHSLRWVITWAHSSFRTWWTVTVSVAEVMPSSLTPLSRCALSCRAWPRPSERRTLAWPAAYAWAMRTFSPAPSHGSCEDLHSIRWQCDPFTVPGWLLFHAKDHRALRMVPHIRAFQCSLPPSS